MVFVPVSVPVSVFLFGLHPLVLNNRWVQRTAEVLKLDSCISNLFSVLTTVQASRVRNGVSQTWTRPDKWNRQLHATLSGLRAVSQSEQSRAVGWICLIPAPPHGRTMVCVVLNGVCRQRGREVPLDPLLDPLTLRESKMFQGFLEFGEDRTKTRAEPERTESQ